MKKYIICTLVLLTSTAEAQLTQLKGPPTPAVTAKKPSLESEVNDILKETSKEEAARRNVRDAVRDLTLAVTEEDKRDAHLAAAAEKLKAAAPDLPVVESTVAADIAALEEKARLLPGGYYDRAAAPRLVLVQGAPANGEFRSRLIEHGTNRSFEQLAWKQSDAFDALGIFSAPTDQGTVYLPRFGRLEELERAAHAWGKGGWTFEDLAYSELRGGLMSTFWLSLPGTLWKKGIQTDYSDTTQLRKAVQAGWHIDRSFINTSVVNKAESLILLRKGRDLKFIYAAAADIGASLKAEVARGWRPEAFSYFGRSNSAAWITRAGENDVPEYELLLGLDSPGALAEALDPMLTAEEKPWEVVDFYYSGTGTGMWLTCGKQIEPIFEENTSDAIDVKLARLAELAGNRLGDCKFEKLFHHGPGALALFLIEAK